MNLIKTYILGLVLSGALGATFAQTPDPTDACFASLPTQKELQILKGKIDLASGPVSLETLSNNKKPTPNEKVAILAFDKTVEQCRELGKDWRLINVPSTIPNNWANSPNNWANSPNNWANNPANSNAQNSVLNNNGERIGYETISPQGVRNIYDNNGQRLGYTPVS